MGCCDNTNKKFNCGKKHQASCTFYKEELPKYSELEKGCVTLEETTTELYKHQDRILKSIDTSDLGKECLEYPTVEIDDEDVILIKDVLLVMEEKICLILDANEEPDTSLELDFKCLADPCEGQITSLNGLLQVLINEVCTLKQQVGDLMDSRG